MALLHIKSTKRSETREERGSDIEIRYKRGKGSKDIFIKFFPPSKHPLDDGLNHNAFARIVLGRKLLIHRGDYSQLNENPVISPFSGSQFSEAPPGRKIRLQVVKPSGRKRTIGFIKT